MTYFGGGVIKGGIVGARATPVSNYYACLRRIRLRRWLRLPRAGKHLALWPTSFRSCGDESGWNSMNWPRPAANAARPRFLRCTLRCGTAAGNDIPGCWLAGHRSCGRFSQYARINAEAGFLAQFEERHAKEALVDVLSAKLNSESRPVRSADWSRGAGRAVQSLNIMFGVDETAGRCQLPLLP